MILQRKTNLSFQDFADRVIAAVDKVRKNAEFSCKIGKFQYYV